MQRTDVPPEVDQALRRATAKDYDDRYPDITTFARDLRGMLAPDSRSEGSHESLQSLRNPYKGLAAFEESDAVFFYGREAMTERLLVDWQTG